MTGKNELATNRLGTVEGVARAGQSRGTGAQISLVVFHGEASRVVRLTEGRAVVLGRDPTAEISIADDSISRRHASFTAEAGSVTVADLGSTNGTKLNGAPVEKAVMSPGDEVTLGSVTVSLHVLVPVAAAAHGVATHDQFLASLDDEVERARTFGRGFAVMMLRWAGPLKPLQERLRSVDRLALYADGIFEVLLPEASKEDASRFLVASKGLAGVAVYPTDGRSAEALLEAARDAMHGDVPKPQATALVSASPAMQAVFTTVERIASSMIPVLIRGETGVGKEVLARAIHEKSPRARQRLVSINCGAIAPTLVESVLFGHERGAFTGAVASTRGVFEEGDGSTVLLDEVGELSATAQAALLRVLETKEIRRVGGAKDLTVDVRVIAATHRDLEAMVKAGTFREDLLYRLNAMTLELPPLRERPEEVGPLAERFVAQANAANGRAVKGLDAAAMRLLLSYAWPGNIRELKNAIEHAVVVAAGSVVQPGDLPRRVREAPGEVALPAASKAPDAAPADLKEGVQRYERQAVLEALRAANGNRAEAARRLSIPVRTLSHKLKQLGIKKLGFGPDDQ
ncbi:MAG: sigma 54-interacting transcriptional regulator [Myxococcaceae bacterium]|nr:sigma 54-interacting transcriptional regulator [Myxococcaceae bacterium]